MAYYEESPAERAFREAGTIYHLYTKPLESDTLYRDQQDRKAVINILAISIKDSNCTLLAFSMMTNHFHFILEGALECILSFYRRFMSLLKNYYRYHGKSIDLSSMTAGHTSIDSIKQFRNELAYVIRNSFVVNPDVHVFADPWSSGYLYFNSLLHLDGVPGNRLSVREARAFAQSKSTTSVNASIYVKDGVAQLWSFVDYKRTESFYDNARQFVNSVLKNVEAQVEMALKYGEDPALNDDDMWPIVFGLCRERFKAEKPSLLSVADKKQLAIQLKNKYHSSNKQLARLTGLLLKDVDAMYPLAGTAQNR